MVDFFISRNKADQAWATWIAWELETAGYTTVIQDWDFRPGSNFVLEMQSAASDAGRTILVLSPDYLTSEYTASEWATAFTDDPSGAKRKLIPVRVRSCEPTGLLKPIVYIDLVDLDETGAKQGLLQGVKQLRAKPSKAPAFPGTPSVQHPKFPGSPKRSRESRPKRPKQPEALGAEAIAARIDEHHWGVDPDRGRRGWTGDVWLGMVLAPERTNSAYIDELSLGDAKLHDQVLSLALVGASGIFRVSRRTETSEQSSHVAFVQYEDQHRRAVAMLETHSDGTLIYRTVIDHQSLQPSHSMASAHIIDEDAVRSSITTFISFAGEFYKRRRRDPGNLYLGLSLSDIAFKHFGRLPNHELNSFTIGDPRLKDPLHIPAAPLKITKTQLAKPETVAQKAVAHIARVFRLAGAYYPP